MLAEDLQPENLFAIASSQTPSSELLAEISGHPACYPKLKAWAEYVRSTGEKIAPPAPPSLEPAEEIIIDPAVSEENTVLAGTKTKSKLLWGRAKKKSSAAAPLPAKNRRKTLIIAGGVGLAALSLTGVVVVVQILSASNSPAPASATPIKTEAATPVTIDKKLTAGGDGFICEAQGSEVNCWGQNLMGQLGAGTTSPEHAGTVKLDSTVRFLTAGADFVCASSGKGVTCWGDNRWKMAGDIEAPILPPTPVAKMAGKPVSSLSAGELHVCLTSSGQVYCWGSGFSGQLADGQEGPKASGVKEIPLPKGQTAQAVLSSRFGSCISTKQGKLYCWGSNEGQRIAEGDAQYLGVTEMKILGKAKANGK